jgi:hypothetical protein
MRRGDFQAAESSHSFGGLRSKLCLVVMMGVVCLVEGV